MILEALMLFTLSEAPIHDSIFFNARMALRAGEATESVKLWLLRNSVVDLGSPATHDDEFHSVIWAALGDLALCQDGYPKDDTGAGLWPLALHNWVLTSTAKGGPEETTSPFDTFEAGLQQRFISLHDVLSSDELASVSFFRTKCWSADVAMLDEGQAPFGDLNDRLVAAPLLRSMLVKSLATLKPAKVRNRHIIEARIFDLDVAIAALRVAAARLEAQSAGAIASAAGASASAIKDLDERARRLPPNSKEATFLRTSLTWPTSDWLALSQARRLSLFAQAKAQSALTPLEGQRRMELETDPVALAIIDGLIEQKAGAEVESWVGWLDASSRRALIDGERGKRLLELEPAGGFRERSVIALHRGVAQLETGEMREALTSFAFAMANAETSRDGAATTALARRWLSYVLSRYEVNEDLVATLTALVPKQEYNAVIEDLVWRAALNADEKSYTLLMASARRGSSFDSRTARLKLLAQGNPGALATELRDTAVDEPFFTVRFVRQLVDKLEAEEVDVRVANVPLMKLMARLLEGIVGGAKGTSATARQADELLGRLQALLEALTAFEPNTGGKARALSLQHEAFAGNIRVAPVDALPWPFRAPEPETPSAFTPLVLTPIEWRDAQNRLVFGWSLGE